VGDWLAFGHGADGAKRSAVARWYFTRLHQQLKAELLSVTFKATVWVWSYTSNGIILATSWHSSADRCRHAGSRMDD
jgi:hypothetical protein